MAIDAKGSLIDPYSGVADLQVGILRSVGDASERLGEDGLRIMRAFGYGLPRENWGGDGTDSLRRESPKYTLADEW